ncbi:hypothetical protein ScPMuIL_010781 [Solemya velum]
MNTFLRERRQSTAIRNSIVTANSSHKVMGQVLRRLSELDHITSLSQPMENSHLQHGMLHKFPNLTELPPELSLIVLSHLNATDLCLASCVWDNLANDELLWQG